MEKSKTGKGLLLFLCLALAIGLMIGCRTEANAKEQLIRIGYYPFHGYQEVDDHGVYSGYAYEYYQEIAQLMGWRYEFVEQSFDDCLKSLLEGRLDILCSADIGLPQDKGLVHSESISSVPSGLYARLNDDTLTYEDFKAFHGMRVAVLQSWAEDPELDEYCKDNGFSVQKQYYRTQSEMNQALKNGEVDAVYSTIMGNEENKMIARLRDVEIQFLTLEGNPLMEQLQGAMEQIADAEPMFESTLADRYMDANWYSMYRTAYTREEKDCIQSNPLIRVAYAPFWKPIEYYDKKTDSMQGIFADVFRLLEENTGLQFEYLTTGSFEESMQRLEEGEVELLTAMDHSYQWAEQHNVYLSNIYLQTSVVTVGKKKDNNRVKIIALPKNYHTTAQIEKRLEPDQSILYLDTLEDCLRAVSKEQADVTYLNNYVANYYLSSYEFDELYVLQMTDMMENLCIGVCRDADPVLLRIINKGLGRISADQIQKIVLGNTFFHNERLGLKDLLYQNPGLLLQMMMLLLAIILVVFGLVIWQKAKRSKHLKKVSETDALTGIYNRLAAEEIIQQKITEDQIADYPRTMVYLDVDSFKQVNDHYGHPEGDRLLQAVAKLLSDTIRDEDIVARHGGDEFILYLRRIVSEEALVTLLDRLQKSGKILAAREKCWSSISFSVGAVWNVENEMDYKELYAAADEALYEAKGNGKNQYIWKKR